MAQQADEVYRAGLELDLDERTIVAHRLLASLHPEDAEAQPEVDSAWLEEIDSRVDDILAGEVELVSAEESRARVQALLAELHR